MDDIKKSETESELLPGEILTAPGRFDPMNYENLVAIIGLLIIAGVYAWQSPTDAIKIVTPIATGILGYMKGRGDK